MGALQLKSDAFGPHDPIPKKYTSDGESISPPLAWSGVPPQTKELALICFDPDAPVPKGFTHWVVYRISPERTGIREGESHMLTLTEGTNSSGKPGYIGPQPPSNHGLHHYYFWLYALDSHLDMLVQAGLSSAQLLEEIQDHIIQQARLVGTYEKMTV
jgi:Raf kinase inhibitor-like YbhB/YbcL family protein